MPEHYTIVAFLPEDIQSRVFDFANQLKKIDKSLILHPKELYHLTFFSCPLSVNIKRIKSASQQFFKKTTLNLSMSSLIMTPFGISVAAYDQTGSLIRFRNNLSEISRQKFHHDFRGQMSWITMIKFSQSPEKKVVKIALKNLEHNFGSLRINHCTILRTHTKTLEDATEIASI